MNATTTTTLTAFTHTDHRDLTKTVIGTGIVSHDLGMDLGALIGNEWEMSDGERCIAVAYVHSDGGLGYWWLCPERSLRLTAGRLPSEDEAGGTVRGAF